MVLILGDIKLNFNGLGRAKVFLISGLIKFKGIFNNKYHKIEFKESEEFLLLKLKKINLNKLNKQQKKHGKKIFNTKTF